MSNLHTANNELDKFNITLSDIKDLDTERLREVLLQSLYLLSGALTTHAAFENSRIGRLSSAVSQMESKLTDPVAIDKMDKEELIEVYKLITNASNKSFESIIKLTSNINTSIDTVSKIDLAKTNMNKGNINPRDPVIIDIKKSIIEEMNKRKS